MRIRGVGTVLILAMVGTILLLSSRSSDTRGTLSLPGTRRSLVNLEDVVLLRSREVPPDSAEERHSTGVDGK
jgi:hypothetical protein